MRYFTKEWYELMQQQIGVEGLTKVADKVYSDVEIQEFYERDLKKEIANDRKLHDLKPTFELEEELLRPENFKPENFLFEDEMTGEMYHPATVEIARERLEKSFRERMAEFEARPPFDPKETIDCFQECYRMGVKYAASGYPKWVQETVDPRLLALQRIPESAYLRLKKESEKCKREFDKINKKAQSILEQQDIPDEIREAFYLHDAHLLSVVKKGRDVTLLFRKDGGWFGETTPYIRITCKGVSLYEREKGLVIRTKEVDGEKRSNCQYLYGEQYRTEQGYEVHMMFWNFSGLQYFTIGCKEILVKDNVSFT